MYWGGVLEVGVQIVVLWGCVFCLGGEWFCFGGEVDGGGIGVEGDIFWQQDVGVVEDLYVYVVCGLGVDFWYCEQLGLLFCVVVVYCEWQGVVGEGGGSSGDGMDLCGWIVEYFGFVFGDCVYCGEEEFVFGVFFQCCGECCECCVSCDYCDLLFDYGVDEYFVWVCRFWYVYFGGFGYDWCEFGMCGQCFFDCQWVGIEIEDMVYG